MTGMNRDNFSKQELSDVVLKARQHGEKFSGIAQKNYEMAMNALMGKRAILLKRKTVGL